MADITKCANKVCHLSGSCYRKLAPTSRFYQSWVEFKFNENGICENYWERNPPEIKRGTEKRRENEKKL